MTLLPVEAPVRGIAGKRYTVGPRCANPVCARWADDPHHIFRRSALGGDFTWVEVAGWTVGNITGLCWRCHRDVTGEVGGHKNAIRLDLEQKIFYWCAVEQKPNRELVFLRVAPLEPQPPTPDALPSAPSAQGASESCPFCGATKRPARPSATPAGERRRRKSWTVSVPDDAENGAEILDTFVDEIAALLGAGDWHERNKRYWALVHALTWTMQQREQFEADVKAAA